MQNQTVQKAADFPTEVLSALEALLGRPIAADEDISVMALRPHDAPSAEVRAEALVRLHEMFRAADERAAAISDENPDDVDEVLDEAIRSVRPNYQRVR